MKINGYQQPITTQQNKQVQAPKKDTTNKNKQETPAAVYEKSAQVADKSHVYDRATIEQLKQDADANYANLKRMVEDLLRQQGNTFNDITATDVIKVDGVTRAEAQAAIAADGPLGVEAMSDKIVQFAKAISGGDPSKLETLRDAITKGFKEAEKILGGLPEVSRKTYDRIMEKLDAWANENKEA